MEVAPLHCTLGYIKPRGKLPRSYLQLELFPYLQEWLQEFAREMFIVVSHVIDWGLWTGLCIYSDNYD